MKKTKKVLEIDLFDEEIEPFINTEKETVIEVKSDIPLTEKKQNARELFHFLLDEIEALSLPFLRARIYRFTSPDEADSTARKNAITNQINNFNLSLAAISNDLDNENVLDDVLLKLNELKCTLTGIKNNVDTAEKLYYQKQALSLLRVLDGKTFVEIKSLEKRMNAFLNNFKSFSEAASYCFNHASVFNKVILSLTKALETKKALLKTDYFYPADNIVILTLQEWVSVYNKIIYVIKQYPEKTFFQVEDFKQNYEELELFYLIVLMDAKRKENKNES